MKRIIALLAVVLFAVTAHPAFAQQEGQNGAGGFFLQQTVAADFTDANSASAQNIPALQFNVPSVNQALVWTLNCELGYSQATAAADSFNVQFSVAPSAQMIGGIMATNATAYASGTPNSTSDTSTHVVVTGTPAVTSVLYAHVGGSFKMAANTPTVLNIQVLQGTGANVIVIKALSTCFIAATPSK